MGYAPLVQLICGGSLAFLHSGNSAPVARGWGFFMCRLLTFAVFAQRHKTCSALRRGPTPNKLHMLGDRGRVGAEAAILAGAATKPGGSGVAPPVPKSACRIQLECK